MTDRSGLASAHARVNAALADLHQALADLQRILPESPVSPSGASRYLTVAEAAVSWRCSESYLYGLINSGELPVFRLGRSIRIRADALEQLFAAQAS